MQDLGTYVWAEAARVEHDGSLRCGDLVAVLKVEQHAKAVFASCEVRRGHCWPIDGFNGRQMISGRCSRRARHAERREWRGFAHGGQPGACRAATPPIPRPRDAGGARLDPSLVIINLKLT